MSDPARTAPPEADPHRAGPPWIDPSIQSQIAWRDGDVVISVPPKSGTTWTMNIVHQLLAGAPGDFRDIYEEVPWVEFIAYPGQPVQEVVDRIEAMPTTARRAFKTHSAPPDAPFLAAGEGPDVKYVVVFRNPEEALVSFRPFLEQHSDAWFDLWGMPRAAVCRPDFSSFYAEVVDPMGMQGAFFGFLAAWWPLRREPNVLFLHFSDMKRDHEGSVRRIAEFIGADPDEETWPKVLEHASFGWMKRHEDKFEARTAGRIPILETGAMIRKGETGQAAVDGMTPEISAHLREAGARICPDAQAVTWLYEGGPLP